jgi:hypothetical protein
MFADSEFLFGLKSCELLKEMGKFLAKFYIFLAKYFFKNIIYYIELFLLLDITISTYFSSLLNFFIF